MMEVHLNQQTLKFNDFVELLNQKNETLQDPIEGVDFERLVWALYNFYWSQTEVDYWLEVFGSQMAILDEIIMRYISHLPAAEKDLFKNKGEQEVLKLKLRRLFSCVGPMQDILLFFTVKVFDDKFDQFTYKERERRLGKYLLQRVEAVFVEHPKYFKLFDDDVSEPEYDDEEF